MAHELEINSSRNTHSFFSRKEVAWHGLGQVIQEAVSPEEALKLANLDYTVELKPIWANFIPDGCIARGNEPYLELYEKNTNLFKGELQKRGVLIPTHKSVCRMDNYQSIGVVGNKYTPVQNIESLNFIYNLLKNRGNKKVAILYNKELDYSAGLNAAFKTEAKKRIPNVWLNLL